MTEDRTRQRFSRAILTLGCVLMIASLTAKLVRADPAGITAAELVGRPMKADTPDDRQRRRDAAAAAAATKSELGTPRPQPKPVPRALAADLAAPPERLMQRLD